MVSKGQLTCPGLLIRPDNTVEVQIDGEKSFSGSLLKDMQPPVNPPKVRQSVDSRVKTVQGCVMGSDKLSCNEMGVLHFT